MSETKGDSQQQPNGLQLWEGSSTFVNQGRHWSSALIWITATLFGSTVLWAFTSKIDQTISVRGRLQPTGSVKEIESPSNGVVSKVFVSDGDLVKSGDPLLRVEARGLISRAKAIEQSIKLLRLEASALDAIIASDGDPAKFEDLPPLPQVKDHDLENKMLAARNQTRQIRSQLEQLSARTASRQESLRLKTQIAEDLRPLYESGAMSRNAYLGQLNSLQELNAEIATLHGERSRIIGSTTAQLNGINRQQITLRSQLTAAQEEISNRTILAPKAGTIFDLKVGPYSVVTNSEILLKIVPSNQLQALIEIPNRDIGFVKVGQSVSVAVDSFPSGEFGYVKGTLLSLGSDSLPPDRDSPQVYFPATVALKEQIVQSGDQRLNLQSGMGLTANIKLRSRPAITIITDIFTRQAEGVKRFR